MMASIRFHVHTSVTQESQVLRSLSNDSVTQEGQMLRILSNDVL